MILSDTAREAWEAASGWGSRLPALFTLLYCGLEIAVRKKRLIGIRGIAGRRRNPQLVHVGRGQATAVVEELLGVVLPRLLDALRTDHNVMGEVERQKVGLLVVTAR